MADRVANRTEATTSQVSTPIHTSKIANEHDVTIKKISKADPAAGAAEASHTKRTGLQMKEKTPNTTNTNNTDPKARLMTKQE